jgi:hypothetical protein
MNSAQATTPVKPLPERGGNYFSPEKRGLEPKQYDDVKDAWASFQNGNQGNKVELFTTLINWIDKQQTEKSTTFASMTSDCNFYNHDGVTKVVVDIINTLTSDLSWTNQTSDSEKEKLNEVIKLSYKLDASFQGKTGLTSEQKEAVSALQTLTTNLKANEIRINAMELEANEEKSSDVGSIVIPETSSCLPKVVSDNPKKIAGVIILGLAAAYMVIREPELTQVAINYVEDLYNKIFPPNNDDEATTAQPTSQPTFLG